MHNPQEVEALARAYAMMAFHAAPQSSLVHFLELAEKGDVNDFDGHRFDTCFYGTLAKGAGMSFVDDMNEEVIAKVIGFWQERGIVLYRDRQNPIEKYFMNITTERLKKVAVWCMEALREFYAVRNRSFGKKPALAGV